MSIIVTAVYAVIGASIYFGITYMTKTFNHVIGKEFINEIFRKKKED